MFTFLAVQRKFADACQILRMACTSAFSASIVLKNACVVRRTNLARKLVMSV
jgi:hypothetical protein